MAAVVDSSCPCGEDDGKLTCGGCRNIKYCSVECQEADWLSHKLLCKTFKDFQERPEPGMRRIIVFLPGESKPKFMWRPMEQHWGYQTVTFQDFMKLDTCKSTGTDCHQFTLKPLKRNLNVRFDDDFIAKYTEENKAITKATGGRLFWKWRGPVFAECGLNHGPDKDITQIRDMDMRSFADLVAFFMDYANHSTENRTRKRKQKVLAVRSNCVGEQRLSGVPPFVQVEVPAFHPVFDSFFGIPKISVVVQMPLQTARYNDLRKFEHTQPGDVENQAITFMHCEPETNALVDLANNRSAFGFPPPCWQYNVGNVLIVKADRKPLKVDTVAAFASYCQHHLLQYFNWQGEREKDGSSSGSYKQKAANEIASGKFKKYLKQWREETKKRAQNPPEKRGDDGSVVLAKGEMALTAREGVKLSNRLFGLTPNPSKLSGLNDELVGATLDNE